MVLHFFYNKSIYKETSHEQKENNFNVSAI